MFDHTALNMDKDLKNLMKETLTYFNDHKEHYFANDLLDMWREDFPPIENNEENKLLREEILQETVLTKILYARDLKETYEFTKAQTILQEARDLQKKTSSRQL